MLRLTSWILCLVVLATGLARADTTTTPNNSVPIEQRILAARTAGDHLALAVEYDKMAAASQDKAEMHRRMADAYKKASSMAWTKGNMQFHCNMMMASYNKDAEQYRALAAEHRKIAEGLKATPSPQK